MPNPYELLKRGEKVDKLIDKLDEIYAQPVNERHMQDDARSGAHLLAQAVRESGIKPPSQLTIDALIERIRERDPYSGHGYSHPDLAPRPDGTARD